MPFTNDMITIIANYIPAELPFGGPNYYTFGENVRYEIHVDNDASIAGQLEEIEGSIKLNKERITRELEDGTINEHAYPEGSELYNSAKWDLVDAFERGQIGGGVRLPVGLLGLGLELGPVESDPFGGHGRQELMA